VSPTVKAPESDRLQAEAAIRSTILQALAGVVVIIGLGFTARTVYVSRETHLTDRLTTAVDQLGHADPSVRLGGIYALQRLARNSPRDRAVVANVLEGYLRVHASGTLPLPPPTTLAPDIQIALSVLITLPT
jgi:hypothetical protein